MTTTNDTPEKRSYPTAKYPKDEEGIRDRINFVLTLYPRISPTMLQIGLGTGFRPEYWRPVLAKMIDERKVIQSEVMQPGPTGRFNMYTFLELPKDENILVQAAETTPAAEG